jgi:flagellar hook-associated protein 1
MSLMSALNAAVSGLRTSQAGINLVAQNVANAESVGYTRRVISPVQVVTGGNTSGVRTGEVQRVLDKLTQRQLRTEMSGAAYTMVRADFASALDRLFGAPGSVASLDYAMNDFTQQMTRLANDPADFSARASVVDRAQTLAARISAIAQGVQGMRTQAEGQIANSVTRANELLAGIVDANAKVTAADFKGGSAALEDERDRMINELSGLMDIQVQEGPNGSVRLLTGSGTMLFDGMNATRLTFDERSVLGASSSYGTIPPTVGVIRAVSSSGTSSDLIAAGAFRSGVIGAALEMRDETLVQAQLQLDELAAGLARAFSDVPAAIDNTTGTITFNGLAGQGVTVDLVIGGSFQRFSLDGPASAAGLEAAIQGAGFPTATVGGPPGGPWVLGLPPGSSIVSAGHTVETVNSGVPQLPLFTDRGAGGAAFTGVNGQLTGFAQRISVNASVIADRSLLVRMDTGVPGTPQGDPTRPAFLLEALTQSSRSFAPQAGVGGSAAPFGSSVTEFGRRVVETQGANAEASQRLNEGQTIALAAIESRFADVSGVNIDQEMALLVQLQTAYGANARVMTAVRDMMDMLMRI